MFNTKGTSAPSNISSYLGYKDQVAKITGIELKEARSGSKQVIFLMEGPEISDPSFKAIDNAKGQVGRVSASIYLKDDNAKIQWITERVLPIAEAIGVREELDKVESADFDDYITKVSNLLKDKPVKWLIGAEEYVNGNNEIRTKLTLPRYNFVGEDVPAFDANNQYHYRKYKGSGDSYTSTNTGENNQAAADDLPF